MHQTRQETTVRLQIPRKGTKYVARALSDHTNSVPMVIAIRDMLKLAKTAKDVEEMIKEKLLKINDRIVYDLRESIKLFDILQAGKNYQLTLTENGRFKFQETKHNLILSKIISKKLTKNNVLQFNLLNGYNVITKEKLNVGDSVYLDFSGKISKHIPLAKGNNVFIISGKYSGLNGKIQSIEASKVKINIGDKETELNKNQIIST